MISKWLKHSIVCFSPSFHLSSATLNQVYCFLFIAFWKMNRHAHPISLFLWAAAVATRRKMHFLCVLLPFMFSFSISICMILVTVGISRNVSHTSYGAQVACSKCFFSFFSSLSLKRAHAFHAKRHTIVRLYIHDPIINPGPETTTGRTIVVRAW